ncbi:hypothetical protein GGI20_002045 [Coemansia sp. BCRC 34301]|nr:hypothetical protein GGI20_002045 [Coemansia sp. BCRC 34301]
MGPVDTQLLVDVGDTDALFAKLSITEMRRYKQSLDQRLETMRAQMRRVASKHYPELIDAADSAVGMDKASAKISNRLDSLRAMLEDTRQVAKQPPKQMTSSENDSGARAKVYAIAAQVKVLVDTPEQIWRALGAQQFVQAALLYMIAREIHDQLCRQSRLVADAPSDGTGVVDPLLAFPVIQRQWEAVLPFRDQIAAKARQLLGSDNELADCGLSAICAIALLEDVDGEMACTVFLAHRGESLSPLLDRLRAITTARGAGELDGLLQELLGRVRQILSDYVAVFGARPGHASRILTTLASICADCDLPEATEQAPALSKRRSDVRPRGRRTSSIAGSVLASSLAAVSGGSALERGAPGNSAFIVGKYLPREIAQFRPRVVQMLDHGIVDALDEADEDHGMADPLDRWLDDPAALLRVLATHVQPSLERAARHALGLWWAGAAAGIQDAAQAAIGLGVLAVVDAARIGAALVGCEEATVVLNQIVHIGPLYQSVVEPLLQARARQLLFAAMDAALSLPEACLANVDSTDVLAGHLPWRRAAGAPSSLAEVTDDIRRSLDFVPPNIRTLGEAVDARLQAAWRDGSAWWQQMSGAAAQPEATACAQHFAEQWDAMCQRLEEWAAGAIAQAGAVTTYQSELPLPVALCVKGAWVAAALASVANRVLATDSMLMRECWRMIPLTIGRLTDPLVRVGERLLEPWFSHLGRSLGAMWAAQFEVLYSQIPHELRTDTAATRRDVVQAWMASKASDPLQPLATRYAALRRVVDYAPAGISPAVRCLVIGLRAQMQAVCGLGELVVGRHLEMRGTVGRAVADAMLAHAPARLLGGWDTVQLAADIRFVCKDVGGDAESLIAALIH